MDGDDGCLKVGKCSLEPACDKLGLLEGQLAWTGTNAKLYFFRGVLQKRFLMENFLSKKRLWVFVKALDGLCFSGDKCSSFREK